MNELIGDFDVGFNAGFWFGAVLTLIRAIVS